MQWKLLVNQHVHLNNEDVFFFLFSGVCAVSLLTVYTGNESSFIAHENLYI